MTHLSHSDLLKASLADGFTDLQLDAILLMSAAGWPDNKIGKFFGVPAIEITGALRQIEAEDEAAERLPV